MGGNLGYAHGNGSVETILICPRCDKPTHFYGHKQMPGVAFGKNISSLPPDVAALYREARDCVSVNAFTPAVLAARKLLMHVAVAQGAREGLPFTAYVDHLAQAGFVPPTGRNWVDYIRTRSNEANHEIHLMERVDAESLLRFIEMLLQLVFEFPASVPAPAPTP